MNEPLIYIDRDKIPTAKDCDKIYTNNIDCYKIYTDRYKIQFHATMYLYVVVNYPELRRK